MAPASPSPHLTRGSPAGRACPISAEAAQTVIPAYLRTHGPATQATFDAWLTRGVSRKAALRSWFGSLGDRLATVEVDGAECYVMAEDLDALARIRPSREVRLLAGFDQYVLGPGTGDVRVMAADRRKDVSRAAGWISPVVVYQGRVVGVWELGDGTVDVRLFAGRESPDLPTEALEAEVQHLAACTGRDLTLVLSGRGTRPRRGARGTSRR